MELNNPRIKKDITLSDKIKVIESIVSSYFTNGIYTPYYAEQAKVIAIAYNFLEGVTFDDDDRVYDLVNSDEKLSSLIDKFMKPQTSKIGQKYNAIMDEIEMAVKDKLDFEKRRIIHNTDAFSIVGDMCTVLADVLNNLGNISQVMTPENIEAAKSFASAIQDGNITEESLTNAVRNAADKFVMPTNNIIEGQRKRIEEQQAQLQSVVKENNELREIIREYQARNVKAKSVSGSGITKGTPKKTARKAVKKEVGKSADIVNFKSGES